jgi:hypothetical protein
VLAVALIQLSLRPTDGVLVAERMITSERVLVVLLVAEDKIDPFWEVA